MLILLILATPVACEWVEIAQQQRRTELSRKPPVRYDGTTKANKIYANYSVTERSWHESGLPRTPNFGIIKRVQLQGEDKDIFNVGTSSKDVLAKTNVNRPIENIGPVRAPTIKMKHNKNEVSNNVKRKSNVEYGTITEDNIKFHMPSRYSDFVAEKTLSESSNIFNVNARVNEKNKYQDIIIPVEENKFGKTKYKASQVNRNINHFLNATDLDFSKGVQFPRDTQVDVKQYLDESQNSFDKIGDTQRRVDTEEKHSSQRLKHKSDNYLDPSQVRLEDSNLDSDTKTNTVNVIWKLMKIVTDNISRNTRRSFRSKIRYLEGLRNNIIANIAKRVDQVWPDDTEVKGADAAPEPGVARPKRTASLAAARGHVEFPSSESALMTISFLTFAVFLIKLVLQVIHTYKNKTMMVTPAVVAAVGRAAASWTLGKVTYP